VAAVTLDGQIFATEGWTGETPDALSAPIRVAGQTRGRLQVIYTEPSDFLLPEEQDLVNAAAEALGLWIESREALQALRVSGERLELLYRLSRSLSTSLEVEEVAQRAVASVCQLVGAEQVTVLVRRPPDRLRIIARAGRETESVETLNEHLASLPQGGVAGWVVAHQAPAAINDVTDDERWVLMPGVGEWIRSALCVPLVSKDEALGALLVLSAQPGFFTAEHLQLVESIAGPLAIALYNARLYEQVDASRERLQALSRRLLEVQEVERRHLARELHDEIGQALTLVKINLGTVQRLLGPSPLASSLDECMATIESALQQVRDLSLDLRPSLLDDLGLVPALRWYVHRQAKLTGLPIEFTADPELERELPADVEIACFRVAQEALTNIMRHAQAEHVSLALEREEDQLTLTVRDDGVGFDVAGALRRSERGYSIGLLGMQERAHLVGGEIAIKSSPGHGAVIRARFPLE
jgi:signal transduction histidine kinase